MATQTRNPTSDIAVTGTLSGSAGSRWTLLDDYPDTSGADVLTFGTTAATIVCGFSAFTVPAGSTDLSVQVLYYDGEAANGANNCSGRLRVGGSNFNAATHNPSGTTYTSRTDNFATNPQTGAAWTVDQVNGVGNNALQGFGIHSTDSSPTFRVSSIQLQVTFTEPVSDIAGSGAAAATAATSSGTGTIVTSGSGSSSAASATSSGDGTAPITATGSAQSATVTSSGTGTAEQPEEGGDITGGGSSTAAAAVTSGSGAVRSAALGSAATGSTEASGSGAVSTAASGASASSGTAVSGAGAVSIAGSGSAESACAESSGYSGEPPVSAAPTQCQVDRQRFRLIRGRR